MINLDELREALEVYNDKSNPFMVRAMAAGNMKNQAPALTAFYLEAVEVLEYLIKGSEDDDDAVANYLMWEAVQKARALLAKHVEEN